jgi:ribosomal protein S17
LAEEFAKVMKEIQQETEVSLKKANEQIKTQYNCHRRPAQEYKVGDMVYLEETNLKID